MNDDHWSWYSDDYRPPTGDCPNCRLRPVPNMPGRYYWFQGAYDSDTGETYNITDNCGQFDRCPAVIAARELASGLSGG